MGFMMPAMMGLSLLKNILPFKDGGAIPPSNAKMRMRPVERLAKPSVGIFGMRPAAKKRGGAVKKRKSKPKK
jgi:hypothetical protein